MRRTASLLVAALGLAACGKKKVDATAGVQMATVSRQDIVVDVEATGVITPINPVQVKSKASGTVLHIYVSAGDQVKPGQLLVQIDPRDPQNRYDQAAAAVQAAQANVQVTKAQYQRNQQLQKQGVITAPELETAQLAYANAQSQLVAARTNLDLAKIALEDVTIRSPMAGTVIEKDVSEGQVIASATGTVSGGTTLLQLANLNQVMDSTLVSESDIGNVKPGLQATVHVDAYPNRTFHGTVEKISPQATVQQSVTMFPVFIRLDNSDRALMPGMNSDVSILVEQRDNVLAVPNDAVRSPRDAQTAARALGLDPSAVQKTLASMRSSGAARGTGAAAGAPTTGTARPAGATGADGTDSAGGAGGAPAAPVSVTQPQCDSVQATIAKHPASQQRLQSLRQQMQNGGDRQALATQLRAVYDSLKLDPRVARACAQLRRGTAGGTALAMGSDTETPAPGTTRPHPGLVFVAQNGTFVPKIAMLGVGNYDVTQVLSGLDEGDKVALINAAMLQQARSQMQQRIQSRVGLPGVQQQNQGNRQGSTGTSGAGGGRRGGP